MIHKFEMEAGPQLHVMDVNPVGVSTYTSVSLVEKQRTSIISRTLRHNKK